MSALGEGILFGLIGAVVIGIPVSVVVFPAALVWAGLVAPARPTLRVRDVRSSAGR